ncbi:MAG: molecular chaperone HtpG [Anaerolineae bacterium]|nr:molecular chaperone HtpG [Anaerolineae bacterium]
MGEQFEFKAEIQQLLHILVHSLYTEREIFLRELLSNASDALHRLQFETLTNDAIFEPEAELAIHLSADKETRTLTIRDSGIGMTHDELITNLGTIAQSGASAFLKALDEAGDAATNIIGQFGVGFYSVFMVADEVQVTSRSYRPDAAAARWTCDGSASFTVEPAEKDTRGTEIVVRLKEDAAEFADEWRLREIVKRHSDFIAFPIYIGEPEEGQEATPVNQRTAIWRQSPSEVSEEAYTDFYKQIALDFVAPLLHVHVRSDAPINLNALLYVPSKRDRGIFAPKEHGLRLYSRKIMIQERTTDLLPEYLRFIEGVVDSEDVPLNVSRESVQSNVFMRKIRQNLVRRLLKDLGDLATNDPEQYRTVWEEFGGFLKEGVATVQEDHARLLPLLRFHSSQTAPGAWTSLPEYVARLNAGKDSEGDDEDADTDDKGVIYYLFGEDLASIKHSPHLDPYTASNTEVLFLTEPIDSFVMVAVQDFAGHKLQNIADADVDAPQVEAQGERLDADLFDPLLKRFNEVLGDRVVAVREGTRLSASPARLVAGDDSGGDSMERVRKYIDQGFTVGKKVMEINRSHPLIHDMARALHRNALDTLVPSMIEQLYENALLVEGIHPNPAGMVSRIQAIMAAAAASAAGPEDED